MAAPEQTIPGLTDLRSFTHVLDFVANREKYSKRIAFLEEKTQECNAAVQRVVALNALGSLQAQVKKDKQTADAMLQTAKAEAKEVREAATLHTEQVHTLLHEKQEALRLHTLEENERLSLWETGLKQREKATNAKKEASAAELERAEGRHEAGLKLKERYGGALEALTKITNEV